VTGYISGNLLISVICGSLAYVVLLILGIPFAGLIALLVGLADLVPLVGATLGGGVAVIAGFLHSTTAGIVVLVFFVVYQQLENHLLQPMIFARTVKRRADQVQHAGLHHRGGQAGEPAQLSSWLRRPPITMSSPSSSSAAPS
jgi:predicted PurR-regulated permease PerM